MTGGMLVGLLALFTSPALSSTDGLIVTSLGKTFRRVEYAGFRGQSSAWRDDFGNYWSDTLPGHYRNCLRQTESNSGTDGCRTLSDGGYEGTSANHREVVDSDAIEACRNIDATPDRNVHLPSGREMTVFRSAFEQNSDSDHALTGRGLSDLHLFPDMDGNWFWTTEIYYSGASDSATSFSGSTGRLYEGAWRSNGSIISVRCVGR